MSEGRHARQQVLPEVGAAGQAAIAAARVLVIGAGGLGVPCLQYLAGAGVAALTIVDPDHVEETNLHRQPLYGMGDLGQPKALAARAALARLAPGVAVTAHVTRFDAANAPGLVGAADVVLDCADSYAASYTASDACLAAGVPLISASALGLSGYVGGFCGGAPSLRALFPDLPDNTGTCATAGILGPVVAMIGALQAQMALSVILGLEPSPLGQLVRLDPGLRFSQFRFDRAPEPAPRHRFIGLGQLRADDWLVELRPETEVARPFAAGAARILPEAMGPGGPLPAPGQRAVLACRSGLRAWRAADRLAARWDGEIALIATGGDPA